MTHGRRFPVRVSLAGAGVASFVFAVATVALGNIPSETAQLIFNALDLLFVLLGGGVVGDTWRPSGQAVSATGAAQTISAQARRGAETDTPPPTDTESHPVPSAAS